VQHSLLVKRAILQKSSGLCGGNTFVSIADNEMDIHYFSPVMDMAHIVTIFTVLRQAEQQRDHRHSLFISYIITSSATRCCCIWTIETSLEENCINMAEGKSRQSD